MKTKNDYLARVDKEGFQMHEEIELEFCTKLKAQSYPNMPKTEG
jgi:hypothetical protein